MMLKTALVLTLCGVYGLVTGSTTPPFFGTTTVPATTTPPFATTPPVAPATTGPPTTGPPTTGPPVTGPGTATGQPGTTTPSATTTTTARTTTTTTGRPSTGPSTAASTGTGGNTPPSGAPSSPTPSGAPQTTSKTPRPTTGTPTPTGSTGSTGPNTGSTSLPATCDRAQTDREQNVNNSYPTAFKGNTRVCNPVPTGAKLLDYFTNACLLEVTTYKFVCEKLSASFIPESFTKNGTRYYVTSLPCLKKYQSHTAYYCASESSQFLSQCKCETKPGALMRMVVSTISSIDYDTLMVMEVPVPGPCVITC